MIQTFGLHWVHKIIEKSIGDKIFVFSYSAEVGRIYKFVLMNIMQT